MTPTPYFALLRRNFAVWLAVLIAVFGALAPTVSHALVWAQGGSSAWTEMCTSTGQRWVRLGPSTIDVPQRAEATAIPIETDSPDAPESTFSLDHCPFCLLALDRAAPPPHASVHFFDVSGADAQPTVRPTFFYVTPFALTPPLRGPPSFS
jgi:hypothetical protein